MNAALLACIANLLLAVLARRVGASEPILWMVLGHSALSAAVLVAATVHRDCGRRWIAISDTLLFAPYYVTLWTSRDLLANITYDPLFGHKILAVGLATFVPSSYRLHIILMAGLILEAALMWVSLPLRRPVAAEPWITAMFFFVAIWFLAWRWRQAGFERELSELRIRTEALTEVARTFVSVRDLAYTPLQKVRLIASMLEEGLPATPERLATLARSVDEIEHILEEFRRYERDVAQTSDELHAVTTPEPDLVPDAWRNRTNP